MGKLAAVTKDVGASAVLGGTVVAFLWWLFQGKKSPAGDFLPPRVPVIPVDPGLPPYKPPVFEIEPLPGPVDRPVPFVPDPYPLPEYDPPIRGPSPAPEPYPIPPPPFRQPEPMPSPQPYPVPPSPLYPGMDQPWPAPPEVVPAPVEIPGPGIPPPVVIPAPKTEDDYYPMPPSPLMPPAPVPDVYTYDVGGYYDYDKGVWVDDPGTAPVSEVSPPGYWEPEPEPYVPPLIPILPIIPYSPPAWDLPISPYYWEYQPLG